MKRLTLFVLCISIFFLFGCSEKKSVAKFSSAYDLNKPIYKIGGEIGTIAVESVRKKLPLAQVQDYDIPGDLYTALAVGKLDAVVYDRPPLEFAVNNRKDFVILPEELEVGHISVGAAKKYKDLMKRIDEYIDIYRADGTYDDMYRRWVKEQSEVMPDIKEPEKPDGVIIIGTDCMNQPFCYMGANGQVTGFDIELAKRVALYLNLKLELRPMDYLALFTACEGGKIDIAIGQLDATPEREETMVFSKPYIDSPVALMIRKENHASSEEQDLQSDGNSGFFQEIKNGFIKTYIREDRWKLLAKGLGVTVSITLGAAFFGTIFGFVVCTLRRSKNRILRYIGKAYIAFIQGTPLLVILMMLYYVIFSKIDINSIYVAIIAFSMDFAAYFGEMLRSGINSVPKGQMEAAAALGFNTFDAYRKVIFPQVIRRIIPIYRGEFINMLKSTSIVGYIAILDLTKMTDIIRSRTYEAFFPLLSTACIYFITGHLLASVLSYMEYKLDPRSRVKRAAVVDKNSDEPEPLPSILNVSE